MLNIIRSEMEKPLIGRIPAKSIKIRTDVRQPISTREHHHNIVCRWQQRSISNYCYVAGIEIDSTGRLIHVDRCPGGKMITILDWQAVTDVMVQIDKIFNLKNRRLRKWQTRTN